MLLRTLMEYMHMIKKDLKYTYISEHIIYETYLKLEPFHILTWVFENMYANVWGNIFFDICVFYIIIFSHIDEKVNMNS